MDINDLSLEEIEEALERRREEERLDVRDIDSHSHSHPMLGKRCLIRTYSAGVHIGDVVYVNPENSMEVKIENCLRLWRWEESGLSLSSVSKEGIKKGRLEKCDEIYLTNALEYIPTTKKAEKTYVEFIEN